MFQLFMIFAIATTLKKETNDSTIATAYYATAIRHADVLSEAPGDGQIQNILLLLVFAHLHGIGSESSITTGPLYSSDIHITRS